MNQRYIDVVSMLYATGLLELCSAILAYLGYNYIISEIFRISFVSTCYHYEGDCSISLESPCLYYEDDFGISWVSRVYIIDPFMPCVS